MEAGKRSDQIKVDVRVKQNLENKIWKRGGPNKKRGEGGGPIKNLKINKRGGDYYLELESTFILKSTVRWPG